MKGLGSPRGLKVEPELYTQPRPGGSYSNGKISDSPSPGANMFLGFPKNPRCRGGKEGRECLVSPKSLPSTQNFRPHCLILQLYLTHFKEITFPVLTLSLDPNFNLLYSLVHLLFSLIKVELIRTNGIIHSCSSPAKGIKHH